jgi:RNA polymerase sigma-70 factor, ECF subfamily
MPNSESDGPADREPSNRWISEMYDELHRMASGYMRAEQPTVSLSPTVLIHELYLRLPPAEEYSRNHFFALASTTMRRVLVDQARSRRRQKRGGQFSKKEFNDWDAISLTDTEQVLAVDEALQDLGQLDDRQAKVVEMKFFGGLTIEEISKQLNVSKRTVESDWTMAKAWLRRRFAAESSGS